MSFLFSSLGNEAVSVEVDACSMVAAVGFVLGLVVICSVTLSFVVIDAVKVQGTAVERPRVATVDVTI